MKSTGGSAPRMSFKARTKAKQLAKEKKKLLLLLAKEKEEKLKAQTLENH